MVLNPSNLPTYSNINSIRVTQCSKCRKTKDPDISCPKCKTVNMIPNNHLITADMLIKKVPVDFKKDGTVKKCKKVLNKEFWMDVVKKHGAINVVIDEAHTIMNSRRSMSDVNKVMGDFLALVRRILGSTEAGYGELILITQIPNKIDVTARDLCNNVRHYTCYFDKVCQKCSFTWQETNEAHRPLFSCPNCGHRIIKRENYNIYVVEYDSISSYEGHRFWGAKSYFDRYWITDGENYFNYYNTHQWDNLTSELYED